MSCSELRSVAMGRMVDRAGACMMCCVCAYVRCMHHVLRMCICEVNA